MRILLCIFIFISQYGFSQSDCSNWLYTPSKGSAVQIGHVAVPGNQLTVEAMILQTKNNPVFNTGDIVSKHTDPSDANYLLRPNYGAITTSNGFFRTPEVCPIEDNKQYHIAMTYDGSQLKFYRDGYLVSQVAATGNLVQNGIITAIGYYSYQYHDEQFFGYINNVRIWNIARSQAQLKAYMNQAIPSPTSQPGLLAAYTFDDLKNKQGNANFDGHMIGSASINQTVSDCNFTLAPCGTTEEVINDYTEVLDYGSCNNELIVADASAYDPGDTVVIIQMKGAAIDQTNTSTFGNISNYNNSGNYEFNIIQSKDGNTLRLLFLPERQYDIADGKVQLVRVPYFGDVTFSNPLTCLPWDGSKGGVLILNSSGTVTLKADIDVSGKGFRSGKPMHNRKVTTNATGYFYDANSNNGAEKGESISLLPDNINYGRGPSSNGGGGGNAHNCGGGGGGNGGEGGMGGDQWEEGKIVAENLGGLGGKALANSAALNKLFLGGSGGMGHANDDREYPAGNGGGIIILIANNLTANGFKIKSNGTNAEEAPSPEECKDGMGGGGAGGSIFIDLKNTSAVSIEAIGGKGADHTFKPLLHGPGGGGGGGVVALSNIAVPGSYTINVNGGLNGVCVNKGNNPYGSTPGKAGKTILNFSPAVNNVLFKKNIDSIRINDQILNCNLVNFQGLDFVQKDPIQSWQWQFGDGKNANVQHTDHEFDKEGIYNIKLVATDKNGCKDSATATVNIEIIKLQKSSDTGICKNSSVQLNVSGANQYQWSPSSGLSNPIIATPVATPSASTRYYVTAIKSPTCSAKDSVLVNVYDLPVISRTSDTSVCKGIQMHLFASGGTTYSWSPSNLLSGSNTATPTAIINGNSVFALEVKNGQGCKAVDTVKVNVFTADIKISDDSTVCSQTPIQLFASGGTNYEWTPLASLNDPYSASPVATPASSTLYHVKVTDMHNCTYYDSVLITTVPEAVFSISPSSKICLKEQVQLNASGGDSYQWLQASLVSDPNISNPVASPTATTTFSVVISEKYCGKKDTLQTVIEVLPVPLVKASSSNNITCSQPFSRLTALGNARSYEWSPALYLDNPKIYNPVATPSSNTNFVVTATDVNGCSSRDSVSVKVDFTGKILFELPNAFTPNGDGINDCFGISNWGRMEKYDLKVFNRFGQLVFQSSDPAKCWDGTFKGKKQDADVFVYIVNAETDCGAVTRKGVVTLIR